MAASSTSTLRARARGLAQRQFGLALFVGVAALPLVTMGITVPSAISKGRAVDERQEMLARLEQRDGIVRSLDGYRDDSTLLQMEALHANLLAMIPTQVAALDEFGVLRSAAEDLGLNLISVNSMRTHRLVSSHAGEVQSSAGDVLPGPDQQMTSASEDAASAPPVVQGNGTVVLDEVLVSLREPIDSVLDLVDAIRSKGLPTVVLGLDMARQQPNERAFQTELRLGFVRRSLP
ncbi:MAG: hypothetical protein AAGG01_14140 [Planctomycetota bacterium]